ncbi:ricin-type beta-trefoil lectin domain protein [Longispora sp. K20-0274]|uniref:ricin-type beta-trefoil lectin domain protein n=1 Tax=Longispora sp. K20-0274 TaxID=3088255 RepID=UPI00399BA962
MKRRVTRLAVAIGLMSMVMTAVPASAAPIYQPVIAAPAVTAVNGANLAPVPPMGFNNWARYTCNLNEALFIATADRLVSSGLAANGYRTVTVDDCWMTGSRDAAGNLVTNTSRFPHGMKWLADYVHGKGLRFGIYEDAGTSTCVGLPGSWGHEQADANLFASFGVDYVKLDGCNVPSEQGKTQEQTYRDVYAKWGQALANTGRRMAFSESAPAYFYIGVSDKRDWYKVLEWTPQYGQLWREGDDIGLAEYSAATQWSTIVRNYDYNVPLARFAGPNAWNDPDFLILGSGITTDEARSQMSLWSMMAAPLILSTDVTALGAAELAIVGNSDVIAVDQDPLGAQGTLVSRNGNTDILARQLANGDRAVALFNRGGSSATISTTTATVGLPGGTGCTYAVKDLWTGQTSSGTTISATVPAHGTAMFRVTPSATCAGAQPTGQITVTSGKCLDDTGSATTDGTPITLFTCHGGANQRWTFPGDGTARTLGKCLTAAGTADGAAITLSTCTGGATQSWSYRRNGNLVNAASNKCLDVFGGATTTDGARLAVWVCGYNQHNQTWSVPS